ncbi:putative membrane protein [Neobacillus sp. B4I6]|jgi:hypothetical protein|uniref:DUF2269 family protein n=1 Tax=Neobacillus sp. B4I6 TaxID=3373925 RepID=UPI003D19D9B6
MYSLLVFVHVISAFFLGSYLALPFVFQKLPSKSGHPLKASLKIILIYTLLGHFALVFLTITGGWMVMAYSTQPSILWIVLAFVLLVLIGGLIGMMNKEMKSIIHTESSEKKLVDNMLKLKWYGWMTFTLIVLAAFIMINRNLFS